MPPQKLFIETNVQFIRIFGTKRQKEIIRQKLEGNIIYTAQFVFREFQSLVIDTLIEFHSFVELYENVTEAGREFNMEHSFERDVKTLMTILLEELESYRNPMRALARLELIIGESISNFYEGINFLIDNVKCPATKQQYLPGSRNLIKYADSIRCNERCCIEFYMKQKRNRIEEILNSIDAVSYKGVPTDKKNEFKNLIEIYREIKEDFTITQKYLKKLGDTVIGFECPKTAKLVTYDNIFLLLGQVLKLDCDILKHPKRTTKTDAYKKLIDKKTKV